MQLTGPTPNDPPPSSPPPSSPALPPFQSPSLSPLNYALAHFPVHTHCPARERPQMQRLVRDLVRRWKGLLSEGGIGVEEGVYVPWSCLFSVVSDEPSGFLCVLFLDEELKAPESMPPRFRLRPAYSLRHVSTVPASHPSVVWEEKEGRKWRLGKEDRVRKWEGLFYGGVSTLMVLLDICLARVLA
jgi:hypothetical protein